MLLRNSRIKCACANVMTKSLWKGRSLGYETPNSNSKKKKKKFTTLLFRRSKTLALNNYKAIEN